MNLSIKPITDSPKKTVTILGSTGTIGQNTIELIKNSKDSFSVHALTAKTNVPLLASQAKEIGASLAVIEDESLLLDLKKELEGTNIDAASGGDAIIDAASSGSDMVISGIVGSAALAPTFAAIKNGIDIGMANKECLVCAGELLINEAKKTNSNIIPIDSEHNAIFQCFDKKRPEDIEKITLTASGGPFLKLTKEELENVTPEQAISHPNWNMGAKISVDSATMMNKGLEVIEAFHLFPVALEQIDVLVHPESVVHCLVHYKDGSVMANMSNPDMKVPISYALNWPSRMETNTEKLDLAKIGSLNFENPDYDKFPALNLARNAIKTGGTAPTILNASNEVAVESFINGEIKFTNIVKIVEEALNKIEISAINSVEEIFETDITVRQFSKEHIKRLKG